MDRVERLFLKVRRGSPVLRFLLRVAFRTVSAVGLFLRAFNSSPTLWLMALIAIYLYRRSHALSPPYSFEQLLSWFGALDPAASTALLGILVTVMGFVVAFSVAHSSWRAQRRTDIRLAAGEELLDFFTAAVDELDIISDFASQLIDAQEAIGSGAPSTEVDWRVERIVDSVTRCIEARERTANFTGRVHSLQGRHHNILASQPMATTAFETAKTRYLAAAAKIYFVAPITKPNPAYVLAFLRHSSTTAWAECVAAVEMNSAPCLAAAAGLRAMFQADVVRPNLWFGLSSGKTANTLFPPKGSNP